MSDRIDWHAYWEQEVAPPRQCGRCRKFFAVTRGRRVCAVFHGGGCCHLYDREMADPNEPDDEVLSRV